MKRILLMMVIFSALLFSSCDSEKKSWLDSLTAAEEKEFSSGAIPEERIANLKKGISYYEKDAARTVKASKQIGIYYRMLALEYMSLEMYNEALKSIEAAVDYFPTSPMLFYYGAVCSAQMTQAVFDEVRADSYLDTAEQYYLRALQIDPGYTEALYGLSVLYIFELNRPLDAEPLLERLLSGGSANFNAMFLLARVKILRGETDAAEELYSTIEEKAPDDETKQKAKDNRMRLVGGYNG
ncbi:MAG: tetratricopeptide repeat protein [Spirochaetales bacterium]|uniref:Tetratricopeptide repeat protein n=1 Tax=Candidatus Thalassospirochaeta sargassi TaxID=3119039 RepID=A0AAJ1ILX4_9SPIO|nr:tetratricopeptide repeat protein [Spirochaetales bacterium]